MPGTNDSFACTCFIGFEWNIVTRTCDPICNPSCSIHGNCTDVNSCTCDAGYYDVTCSSCEGAYFGCSPNAACVSVPKSHCVCNVGYTGDGATCSPVCHNCTFGVCVAPETCQCYIGSGGTTCNECDPTYELCSVDAVCGKYPDETAIKAVSTVLPNIRNSSSNTTPSPKIPVYSTFTVDENNETVTVAYVADGSYYCACSEGFTGDGIFCNPICTRGCLNGVCQYSSSPHWGTCQCYSGWSGDDCSVCISGYQPNVCGFNSFCDSYANGSTFCNCTTGYVKNIDGTCKPSCSLNGCVNGICTAPNICNCSSGWGGTNCAQCPSNNKWFVSSDIILTT